MNEMLSFEEFWNDLSEWSQETFGSDLVRGPTGPLKHLAKEVNECLEKPNDLEEYADLQFLVFDSARRAGFTVNDLKRAFTEKLKINKMREWNKPSSDEPVEHIRKEEKPEQVMFKINGETARCECGCNVFTYINKEKTKAKCNSCDAVYILEKKDTHS